MLNPWKPHTNNLQAFFNCWKRHQSRRILDQINPTFQLIFSTAVFLQRNENTVIANIAVIKSMEVKTRNSNYKHLFVLFVQNANLQATIHVIQCFSTGAPRNLRVPRVAARGSVETDRNCLGRNSQPQFYPVVAVYTPGSLYWVPRATQTFADRPVAAIRLKNNDVINCLRIK